MIDLSGCKSLSDISLLIYGNKNYNNREKTKKFLSENGIDWKQFLLEQNKCFCLNCGKEITSKDKYRRKFCSHSCSASFNNKNNKKITDKICPYCGAKFKGDKEFCSKKCKISYNYDTFIKKWLNGEKVEYIYSYIKKYLFSLHNNKCQECGWDKINKITNKVPLQIHHIDGDCNNNDFNNLKLLCPNCHSLTENYSSLNKKSNRVDRRTKYFRLEIENNDKKCCENKRCIVCGKKLNNYQIMFCSLNCKHRFYVKNINKNDILNAFKECKTKTSVAKKLKISTTTLNKKIVYFNIINEVNDIINGRFI